MRADTKQQTQMNTQSTDVSASFAADPEYTEVTVIVEFIKLALVNCADTELTLDCGDQRRTLEKGTSECLESSSELRFAARDLVMETNDADVFLSGTLLGLDQASGTVDTDDQAASDLGIESA